MGESVLSDIFFVTASLASVAVLVGIAVVLRYAIPIARDAEVIVRRIRAASKEVEKDLKQVQKTLHGKK